MVSHFVPHIHALSSWGPFISANQHGVYIATCLPFWQQIFQSVRWFTPHLPFWIRVSKLLSWLFRATIPLPEAPRGVRAEPVYYGAPVTATDPAAARWRVGDKPISCGVDSVTATGIPAALPQLGHKLICCDISSVTSRVLIARTKFTVEI